MIIRPSFPRGENESLNGNPFNKEGRNLKVIFRAFAEY